MPGGVQFATQQIDHAEASLSEYTLEPPPTIIGSGRRVGGNLSNVIVEGQGILDVRGVVKDIKVQPYGIFASGSSSFSRGVQQLGDTAAFISEISGGVITGSASGLDFSYYCGNNSPWGYVAYLYVGSGGKLVDTTLRDGANLTLSSGASAVDMQVQSHGFLGVHQGATVTNINLQSGAYLTQSGGNYRGFYAYTDITVGSIDSSGVLSGLGEGTVGGNSQYLGDAFFAATGNINNIILKGQSNRYGSTNATMNIVSGGNASNITLEILATLNIESGALVTSSLVNSMGTLSVGQGGKAKDITVNSDGKFIVLSGGTATGINLTDGAGLCITVAPDTYVQWIRNDSTYEVKGNLLSGAVLDCDVNVISGTVKNTVFNGGALNISSGAVAENNTISAGNFYVYAGGTANNNSICARSYYTYGNFIIFSGGTANGTILNDDMIVSDGGIANNTIMGSGGGICISSGGFASNTTVNSGYMDVYGSATNIILNGGSLYIDDSSLVNKVTVNAGASMHIYGTATEVMENGGFIYVNSKANITFVSHTISGMNLTSTSMSVHSNTVVKDMTVGNSGYIHIFDSGVVNNIYLNDYYASMYISSGGTANDITCSSGGGVAVSSGGFASGITLDYNGRAVIHADGSANGITVNDSGYVTISSGGTATQVLENGGYVDVKEGANVTFAAHTICNSVFSEARATIHSGTVADNVTITLDSYITVFDGGIIKSSTIKGGDGDYYYYKGDVCVSSGGVVNDITVSSGGYLHILSGGTANKLYITGNYSDYSYHSLCGSAMVSTGGLVNDVVVDANGYFKIFSGGTATGIKEDGGYVEVEDGAEAVFVSNTISGKILSNGSMTVHKNTVAEDIQLNYQGRMFLYDGGVAKNTDVCYYGSMIVAEGGVAENTLVYSYGVLNVASGGTATIVYNPWQGTINSSAGAVIEYLERDANIYVGGRWINTIEKYNSCSGLTISSGYEAIVYSGGTANDLVVNPYGILNVSSGGTASIAYNPWLNSSSIHSADGAVVEYLERNANVYIGRYGVGLLERNDSVSGWTLNSGISAIVYSGGTANDMLVTPNGYIQVMSGGTAAIAYNPWQNEWGIESSAGATVEYLERDANVYIGGYSTDRFEKNNSISDKTLTSGESAIVYSNGLLDNTSLEIGAALVVSSGGTASEIIENGGYVSVEEGANITFASHTISGLICSYYTTMTIHKNTVAEQVMVAYSGLMNLYSGGIANNTTVSSGSMCIMNGGTASNTTVSRYSTLQISSGGKHCGALQIISSGNVHAESGSIIDFTLTDRTASETPLITNLSRITGAPAYTITVSANQARGMYALAGNADKLSGSITIGDGSIEYGTLTPSLTPVTAYGDNFYQLILQDDTLWLDVKENGPDLYVASVTTDGLPVAGKDIVLTFQIANHGKDAAESVVYIYDGETKIDEVNISAIAAGGTATGTYTIAAGTLAYGAHDIRIVADGSGVIDEVLENNNTANHQIFIDNVGPELNNRFRAIQQDQYTLLIWDHGTDLTGTTNFTITIDDTIYETEKSWLKLTDMAVGEHQYSIVAYDKYGNASTAITGAFTVVSDQLALPDVLFLKDGEMPQAEYMYGCIPTAVGMLLGYYDLYGYTVDGIKYDFSNLIEGTITVDSRGSDGGSIYDMKDPSLLASFIASTDYVSRFYGKSAASELAYTFINSDVAYGLNVSAWNSLADYLGTGQYWRGNADLNTRYYYADIDWLLSTEQQFVVDSMAIPVKYIDFKYGLSLYVQEAGYALDTTQTASYTVSDFSFYDFREEIAAGRPVLISMSAASGAGHMVVAYGYDARTNEIIFDDTYNSDCRMKWDGSYNYAGESYTISGITTVVFETENTDQAFSLRDWNSDQAAVLAYAKEHNIPILAYYGWDSCPFCQMLESHVYASDAFKEYVNTGSVILLNNIYGLGIPLYSTPTYAILSPDGEVLSYDSGFGGGTAETNRWMDWFDDYVTLKDISENKVDLNFAPVNGDSDHSILVTGKSSDVLTNQDMLKLSFAIQNSGTVASGDFQVAIYIDGELLRTVEVASIAAGSVRTIENIDLGQMLVGAYALELQIDPYGKVLESSYTNNVCTENFSVTIEREGLDIIDSNTVLNDQTTSNMYVLSGGIMNISGGTAVDTQIFSGGIMYASNCTLEHTVLSNYATVHFHGNVYAQYTEISGTVGSPGSNTRLNVSSGATLINTIIDNGRVLNYDGGATFHNTVLMNDSYFVAYNCEVIGAKVFGGTFFVDHDIDRDNAEYYQVRDIEIYDGGSLEFNIGRVQNITLYSGAFLYSYISQYSCQTILEDVAVHSGARMDLSSGSKLEGMISMHGGSVVLVYDPGVSAEDATLNFRVDTQDINDDFMISTVYDVAGFDGLTLGDLYITVAEDQAAGTYKLAQGANNFTGSFSIGTENSAFGALTVNGDALKWRGSTYELDNINGEITLTVSKSSYAIGNFNGMFELTPDGNGTIYTPSGKQEITGNIDPESWELAGAGDFNKSGTDGLLWVEKETGYVYVQNDLTNFDEVNNMSNCLGILDADYEILSTGDFTGTGISGVVMQGPAFGDESISLNYGLPIWGREADGTTFAGWLGALVNTWQPGDALKGDTSDLADINARNYMYEVVSVGDYNGDGVDDVMLQNIMPKTVDGITITGSGDVFTFLTGDMAAVKAGASPTVAYAGCAKDGWEIKGSGDFDGDGIDDVLLSDGTGVAGWKMANGQRSADLWFGNLGASEEISGITDLNNDGTDDILILNTATDTYSGWLVKDGVITGSLAVL